METYVYEFDSEDFLTLGKKERLSDLVAEILSKFDTNIVKTPFYLYSKKQILANFLNYKDSFSSVLTRQHGIEAHVSYSVKANFNPHVLKLFKENGSWCSLVNGNELELCLRCGFSGSNLIFNGNGKTTEEIEKAVSNSCYVNVDSEFNLSDTLKVCKSLSKKANILIRVNPSIDAKVHQYLNTSIKTSKFGINLEQIASVVETIKQNPDYLNLVGYHCHLGSTITSLDVYKNSVDCLLELVDKTEREYNVTTIEMLNIGGGLGIDYQRYASRTSAANTTKSSVQLPTPHDLASVLADGLKGRGKKLKVIVEPGRSLIANTCLLVTKLLGVKMNANRNFLVTDASMCEVIRPCLYSAYHHVDLIEPSSKESKLLFDVVGPVCESGDFLGKDRYFTQPDLQTPVYLAVFDVGAYCGAMASNYNMRLKPAEVLVDDTLDGNYKLQLLRRSDTIDDVLAPFGNF